MTTTRAAYYAAYSFARAAVGRKRPSYWERRREEGEQLSLAQFGTEAANRQIGYGPVTPKAWSRIESALCHVLWDRFYGPNVDEVFVMHPERHRGFSCGDCSEGIAINASWFGPAPLPGADNDNLRFRLTREIVGRRWV